MIKTIGLITLGIIWFLWMSDTKITFAPFSFKMNSPMMGIGWVFLLLGFSIVMGGSYDRGAKDKENEIKIEFDKAIEEHNRKFPNDKIEKDEESESTVPNSL